MGMHSKGYNSTLFAKPFFRFSDTEELKKKEKMFYYGLEYTSLMIPILLVKQFNNIKLLKMDTVNQLKIMLIKTEGWHGPYQEKTCLRTSTKCADSDQPVHAQSILLVFALHSCILR